MPTCTDSIHDSYRILEPSSSMFDGYPYLKKHAALTKQTRYYEWPTTVNDGQVVYHTSSGQIVYGVDKYGAREAMNLAYATSGQITMKMLEVYADGNEHHYLEVCSKLDLAPGHDIDCWRSLDSRHLIECSSKREHGKKYYRITGLGQEVLRVVQTNQVYFRTARWFKLKGEDDICTAMMKADLNGEESWRDLLPETFTSLLEAFFNPASEIRRLGSAYRWMNNLMYLLKSNDDFYEKFNQPEVLAWLQEKKETCAEASRFLKKLVRIQKKRAKTAA